MSKAHHGISGIQFTQRLSPITRSRLRYSKWYDSPSALPVISAPPNKRTLLALVWLLKLDNQAHIGIWFREFQNASISSCAILFTCCSCVKQLCQKLCFCWKVNFSSLLCPLIVLVFVSLLLKAPVPFLALQADLRLYPPITSFFHIGWICRWRFVQNTALLYGCLRRTETPVT